MKRHLEALSDIALEARMLSGQGDGGAGGPRRRDDALVGDQHELSLGGSGMDLPQQVGEKPRLGPELLLDFGLVHGMSASDRRPGASRGHLVGIGSSIPQRLPAPPGPV